ncbi:MAG: bifunctional lysine ketoglutarate reductase /saccharopine dehydrogenase family protein [Elusimicrobiota bacterium]
MSKRHLIGIRREDLNPWEGRVPIIPEHAASLIRDHGFDILIQKSDIRAFKGEEYLRAGATIAEDLSRCRTVFAVKEIPVPFFQERRTYVFFSHTIKGQKRNMPLLRRIMDLGCQLIDYEKMTDDKGRRVVFFGKFAGLAGMIDTLWALGRRLDSEKIPNPLSAVKRALEYPSLAAAEESVREVGRKIAADGLPEAVAPLVCGFAGYGNVSQGAQSILDLLPVTEIAPEELIPAFQDGGAFKEKKNRVFKVVFREEHMVEPVSPGHPFALQDYYDHPEKYRAQFEKYVPYLTVLANCIYWDARYPRLVTKDYLKKLYGETPRPRLRVLGDITCDVDGAIECNVKPMDPGNPVFVYDPLRDRAEDGWEGRGPVVLGVANLPAELPRESSVEFSRALLPFIPGIVKADMSVGLEDVDLPDPAKRALLVHQGKLTPDYRYLAKYLNNNAAKEGK